MTTAFGRWRPAVLAVVALAVTWGSAVRAQSGPAAGQSSAPTGTAQSLAPIDLVGTWVSVVSEDWRWRMLTPPRGDYASVPLTDAGRKAADSWDYQREQTAENACKPFGVGGLTRMPGRVRVSWQNPSTLQLEFDAGTQTRLLRFDRGEPSGPPTWQGDSRASWQRAGQQGNVDRNGVPVAGGRGGRGAEAPRGGSLRVATTNFRPGFLRKNGVPYSDQATILEYFDRLSYPNGDEVLLIRTEITDPQNLQMPFITSTHFKREPSPAKWKATPCAIDPPVVRPVVTR